MFYFISKMQHKLIFETYIILWRSTIPYTIFFKKIGNSYIYKKIDDLLSLQFIILYNIKVETRKQGDQKKKKTTSYSSDITIAGLFPESLKTTKNVITWYK